MCQISAFQGAEKGSHNFLTLPNGNAESVDLIDQIDLFDHVVHVGQDQIGKIESPDIYERLAGVWLEK